MAHIPLFPLPLVLFPGGKLPLQIFEPRYLDMVKRCMRDDTGFGVVLIEEGHQVLKHPEAQLPTVAHCGTWCSIVDFYERPNNMLGIMAEGRVKFSVRDQYERPDRLMMGDVEFLEMEQDARIPEYLQHLGELLETFMAHESVADLGLEIDRANARDVGSRLAELLPCPNPVKQRLLEMKDPLARLREIEKLILRLQDSGGE